VNKSQKTEAVAQLNQTFEENEIVVVCQYKGLTVAEISDFRSKLRAEGANFKVTKNRLARLALKGTRYEGLDEHFTGPTGIAISKDPVAAAKIAQNYSKGNDKLVIIAGALGEKMLDASGVEQLSKLPSLDELRSKLVGLLQAPASKMVGVLQAPAGQIARVVGAYGAKGE
tara:strand:- start:2817 stop:3329 length:513 start_codon:yes stop_codon:yes gene_type:complete